MLFPLVEEYAYAVVQRDGKDLIAFSTPVGLIAKVDFKMQYKKESMYNEKGKLVNAYFLTVSISNTSSNDYNTWLSTLASRNDFRVSFTFYDSNDFFLGEYSINLYSGDFEFQEKGKGKQIMRNRFEDTIFVPYNAYKDIYRVKVYYFTKELQ